MSTQTAIIQQLTAGPDDAGERLDRFLARAMPGGLSRARLKGLIEAGHVAIAGQTIAEPSHRVKPGQHFRIEVPPAVEPTPLGQSMPLVIAFEDEHLIVIDKPAGMVVHPAPGNADRTLVNALIAHCGQSLSGIGGVKRPGIVHRIDKDTSGLLVVAKSDAAHDGLARQFADHSVERAYSAVVWGLLKHRTGEIEGNIGRDPGNRKRMAVVRGGGKPALTRYRLERTLDDVASLLTCRLATGRTHQIRVHLTHIGHPLIGDPLYGRGRAPRRRKLAPAADAALGQFHRQALHARLLGFQHPVTKVKLLFESPLPDDMQRLISALESA